MIDYSAPFEHQERQLQIVSFSRRLAKARTATDSLADWQHRFRKELNLVIEEDLVVNP